MLLYLLDSIVSFYFELFEIFGCLDLIGGLHLIQPFDDGITMVIDRICLVTR